MYSKIINPINNKSININSALGKQILSNYISNFQSGGTATAAATVGGVLGTGFLTIGSLLFKNQLDEEKEGEEGVELRVRSDIEGGCITVDYEMAINHLRAKLTEQFLPPETEPQVFNELLESIDYQDRMGDISPTHLHTFLAMKDKFRTLQQIAIFDKQESSRICTTRLEKSRHHTIFDNEFVTAIKIFDEGTKVDFTFYW